jgi:ArsR family transcriptional regulator
MNAINPKTDISSSSIDSLAALYKACGDELRLEILRALKSDSFGVLELCDIFGIKQSAMSHHLKVLSTQTLVQTRREGNSIFYQRAVADEAFYSQCVQNLYTQIDLANLSENVLKNIDKIKQQRADLGKAFFSKHVDKFREQQELIAQFSQYQDDALKLLESSSQNRKSVLELGPGDGQFLASLSPLFNKVIAVDYAKEMLNQSREFALSHGLNNIEFVLGESKELVKQKIKVDAMVANMVLHHLPSPADCFEDASLLLNKDGVLMITDLCHHEQAWANDACGDLWLGFKESELKAWANQANLEFMQSSFLALRNGFQIVFCSFKKTSH